MHPRILVLAACVLLALPAGCSVLLAQPGQPASTTPSATTTSTAGPPSPTPAESTAAAFPTADGALDVSSFAGAHFANPSGKIWCALTPDWALCQFPPTMNTARVPDPSQVCPGTGLEVTGVSVIQKADYFCGAGGDALPQTNGLNVDWWRATGFGSVKRDHQRLAVLPEGRKLVLDDHLCVSEPAGVACVNTDSGRGFLLTRQGVSFLKA